MLLRYCSSFSIFVYKSFKSKGFGRSQNFFYMCLHPPTSTFWNLQNVSFFCESSSISYTFICAWSEFFYFATFMRAHSNGIFGERVVVGSRLTWIFCDNAIFDILFNNEVCRELCIGSLMKIIFSYCIVMASSSYMINTLRNDENCLWIFNNTTCL